MLIASGLFLREGERAGEKQTFIPRVFPKKLRKRKSRPRRPVKVNLVRQYFYASHELAAWLETRADALTISPQKLVRCIVEFYQAAVMAREKELADEIIRIFPPGTNGISKPFAVPADALRENR